ncbi:hypothetical protein [Geodermatophilus sp. SYSU D00815]
MVREIAAHEDRFVMRLPRTSAVALAGAPVLDLRPAGRVGRGSPVGERGERRPRLAAAYIGFSVAFDSTTLRWAGQRFAHRFAAGPPPQRPPQYGQERARYEWWLWARAVLGWAVACGLLGPAVLAVDDPARTGAPGRLDRRPDRRTGHLGAGWPLPTPSGRRTGLTPRPAGP